MSIDNKLMLTAAEAAYKGSAVENLSEYQLDGYFPNASTGFKATAYTDGQGNYVIAFAGTEGIQDWYQNVKLGWDQWVKSGDEILEYVSRALERDPTSSIHFTGHSLGGALAQYAVYEVLDTLPTELQIPRSQIIDQLSLTTFNGLGGVAGLTQYLQDEGRAFDPSIVAGIESYHYFVEGDLVSRLGGGHLGGNTLMLSDPLGPFDLLTGHSIETVVDLANFGAGLSGAVDASPAYLPIEGARPSAAALVGLLNFDGAAGQTEAALRLGALLYGVIRAPSVVGDLNEAGSGQLNGFLRAVFDNLAESVTLHEIAPFMSASNLKRLGRFDWEAHFLSLFTPQITIGAIALDFMADTLGVALSGIANLLPEPLESEIQAYLNELPAITEFEEVWDITTETLVDVADGVPESYAIATVSELSVAEGQDGELTLTLDRAAPDSGVHLAFWLADSSGLRLSGPGVTLVDVEKNLYRIDVAPGEDTVSVMVSAPADGNLVTDQFAFRVGSVPFSHLSDALDERTYAVGAIEVTEPLPLPDEPTKVIVATEEYPDDTSFSGTAATEFIDATSKRWRVFAGAGDDLIVGGDETGILVGEEGDDQIYAKHAIDPAVVIGGASVGGVDEQGWLSGLRGDELLVGDDGLDVLAGGAGADILVGGKGTDYLLGDNAWVPSSFDWTAGFVNGLGYLFEPVRGADAPAGSDDDSLYGGEGNDVAFAGLGDDQISGGSGADILFGEGGDDALHGGAGDDHLGGDGADTEGAEQGDDLVLGGAGDDAVYGHGGDDRLLGGTGNDGLYGDRNDDTAYHGVDILDGGSGDDWLVGNGKGDTLFGGEGEDELFGDAADLSGQFHGNDLLDGGLGADQLIGGGADDSLFGGGHGDRLWGDTSAIDAEYHGNDLLDGGAGDDQLVGGGKADILFGANGADRLYGDVGGIAAAYHGTDLLDGGEGDDLLVGGGAADTAFGGTGGDALYGDAPDLGDSYHSADLLDGGLGDDALVGGGADDSLFGGEQNDRLYGDSPWVDAAYHGADLLDGGAGNDLLEGNGGADVLDGGAGADVLRGGAGDDALYGGADFDILSGGGGVDRLHGGAGSDLYRFGLGNGTVFISDSGSNVLRFGPGIGVGDIRLGLGSLKIGIAGTDDAVHIEGFDPDNPHRSIGIDRIEFADGTVLSYEQLLGLGFDLEGAGGNDIITGTMLEDRLHGLGGDDTLIAKAGNDVLDGGAGADRMEGNAGDDHYVVDHTGDTVTEAADQGRDHVESQVDYQLTGNVENLTLAGTARRGVGNAGDNTINGNAGDNVLEGLGGRDSLDGGFGDDTYVVDSSGDLVVEQPDLIDRAPVTNADGTVRYGTVTRSGGHDRVLSSATFTLGHFVEELTLTGTEAIDGFGSLATTRITGNAGDNALYAYRLNGRVDNLWGAPISLSTTPQSGATERLLDRTTQAIYYGDVGANVPIDADLVAGEGVTLTGGAGDDRLFGDWDNDVLRGGTGNDMLYGCAGADILVGGRGDDSYVVDSGYEFGFRAFDVSLGYHDQSKDTLIEAAGGGVDTVMANIDFTLGEHFENLTLLDDTGAFDQDSAVYGEPLLSDYHATVGTGNAGDNRIVGNRYDNRLDGAAGADWLAGGAGDDTYVVDQAGDAVVEATAGWRGGRDAVETALDYTLGANVENLTLTGTEDRTGTGNALDNRLRGNAGANVLAGLAGADALYGGAGDDMLTGGSGDDRLDGGVGNDRMEGGAGDDNYVVDAPDDTVIEAAGAGYDRVESSITRTLSNAVEHLRLRGSADIDGAGNALANRIEGNAGSNRLRGQAGNDSIAAGDGADVLSGGAGDDRLDGEAGADLMAGGSGDDRYVVDSQGDAVQEADDAGHDTVVTSLSSYTLTENVEDLELNGRWFSTGTGNALDNRIEGHNGANALYGRAGDDSIDAAAGNDVLYGEEGNDYLYGGDDAIREGYPDYGGQWYGDGEWGYGGYCEVLPNSDVAYGGAGDDHLDGGSGDDVLYGDEGDDYLYGGNDGISCSEGGGVGPYGEYYSGGYPYGGQTPALGNDDALYGGAGRDVLRGGTADDLLNGGTGIDDMAGGAGNDRYYVDGYAEVIDMPGGGKGGEGSDDDGSGDDDCSPRQGQGNEGVGNGEDPPPPGHDDNRNDGFGTSPGNPGSGHDGSPHRGNGREREDDGCHHGADDHGAHVADDDEGCGSGTDGACGGYGDLPGNPSNDGGATTPRSRIVLHTDQVAEAAYGGYDVVYSSATFVLPEHAEELHLTGSAAIDATGSAGADWLYGNDAANRLDGGAGADYLAGGDGDDTYVVRDAGDTVVERGGGGVDTVQSAIDRVLAGVEIENLTLIGAATSGTGNAGDNLLTGNAGNNTLVGLAGNDVLNGAGGADTLRGGDGADVYVYTPGTGVDRIEDGAGANRLRFAGALSRENVVARTTTADGVTTVHVRLVDVHGNELHQQGMDFVLGPDGASPITSFEFAEGSVASLQDLWTTELHHQGSRKPDRLTTGRADDVIDAYGKRDTVWAGGGRDTVDGGSGSDRLSGQGGDDRLSGGTGRDRLSGGMGFDALIGGDDADTLHGGCQNDLVLGGAGDDRLCGDGGNDAIAGGQGDDVIDLEAGADVVCFNAGDGHDQVRLGDNQAFTVSLGGELRLDQLALYRAEDDLLLRLGERENGCGGFEGIAFEDWYERAPGERPEVTLQMVMEASEDFDAASADPRRNRRFTRYDLNALASGLEADGCGAWSTADSLLDAHLGSSSDRALGGEPAYRYGLTGNASGLSTTALVGTLTSPEFGESPQRIAGSGQ